MNRKGSGFTLIELLIVVAIIGILAGLILSNLYSARAKARDAERKSDLRAMATSLESYYGDNGSYPAAASSLTPSYIGSLPVDPLTGTSYGYTTGSDANGLANRAFRLSSEAENESDPDINADGSFYFCGGAYKEVAACEYTCTA